MAQKKNMKQAIIINQPNEWEIEHGLYIGRKGVIDLSPNEKYHNNMVMFYPEEGEYPYRICCDINLFQVI